MFGLSVPLWVAGGITGARLPAGLPLAALQAFVPVLAASLLVFAESGPAGVPALLARSFDARRIRSKAWYAPILLTFPAAMLVTAAAARGPGMALPAPVLPIAPALAMTAAFVLSGFGEELGWSGYATDPLQARWGALNAGLLLGIAWAGWHVVPLAQAGREPAWVAGWTAFTMAARVLTVWIYNNTGRSVFATALFHASSNACTVLFASSFVPVVTGPIVAVMAAVVAALWGPRTLARFRWA
ncbi:MAG: CPBP family intramembrane metalloprotease [Microthrixaceae bacterium]|nr:CPBP family intramembrane metalloprotease [Microthrixaceae bacterium]